MEGWHSIAKVSHFFSRFPEKCREREGQHRWSSSLTLAYFPHETVGDGWKSTCCTQAHGTVDGYGRSDVKPTRGLEDGVQCSLCGARRGRYRGAETDGRPILGMWDFITLTRGNGAGDGEKAGKCGRRNLREKHFFCMWEDRCGRYKQTISLW